jgi:uncharacterized protein (DUF1330 family)
MPQGAWAFNGKFREDSADLAARPGYRHAQVMPAYLIARVEITEWARYREYMKATPAAIAAFGGKFIVRGGEITTLEGVPETRRLVIIEFPSLEQAKAFYSSPEYTRAKGLREGAAVGQFILVPGV